MAVVVTNMNMPGSCAVCEFGRRFDNVSCLCERLPSAPLVQDLTGRPNWCPLKEIQEGKNGN